MPIGCDNSVFPHMTFAPLHHCRAKTLHCQMPLHISKNGGILRIILRQHRTKGVQRAKKNGKMKI